MADEYGLTGVKKSVANLRDLREYYTRIRKQYYILRTEIQTHK